MARRRLYPPGRSPLRDGVEPEAVFDSIHMVKGSIGVPELIPDCFYVDLPMEYFYDSVW